MRASEISIDKAKQNKLFYFVANVVVYHPDKKQCLILRRSDKEIVHPGKYCVPGGKLEWADLDLKKPSRLNGDVIDFENTVEDLLRREVKEEAGIDIESSLKYLNSNVFVRPDGVPVVLVKFAARYVSGEVRVEKDAFSDYAWVDGEEIKRYDCILGVADEVRKTIKIFEK